MTATFWYVLRLAERRRGVPTLWQSVLATVTQR